MTTTTPDRDADGRRPGTTTDADRRDAAGHRHPLRVLVVVGHPRAESLCGALADAYASGARAAGAHVTVLPLAGTTFDVASRDPSVLRWRGEGQELEPDVADAIAAVRDADHVVLVFPQWWGTYPAVLKGFVDRVFLSQFAFASRSAGHGWDKLLTGRTARLVMTMDSPVWWDRLKYRSAAVSSLRHATLWYCGIRTVGVTRIARVRHSDAATRQRWLERAERQGGRDGARRPRDRADARVQAGVSAVA